MSDITLTPYIFFQGNCREAFEFYKDLFGGELSMRTNGEAPVDTPEGTQDQVIYAALTGGDIELMGSDSPKASAKAAKVTLSLSGEDEEKLTYIFNRLGEGGTVLYPLKKEFWGDIFGNVVDTYGVEWMVNISSKEK